MFGQRQHEGRAGVLRHSAGSRKDADDDRCRGVAFTVAAVRRDDCGGAAGACIARACLCQAIRVTWPDAMNSLPK